MGFGSAPVVDDEVNASSGSSSSSSSSSSSITNISSGFSSTSWSPAPDPEPDPAPEPDPEPVVHEAKQKAVEEIQAVEKEVAAIPAPEPASTGESASNSSPPEKAAENKEEAVQQMIDYESALSGGGEASGENSQVSITEARTPGNPERNKAAAIIDIKTSGAGNFDETVQGGATAADVIGDAIANPDVTKELMEMTARGDAASRIQENIPAPSIPEVPEMPSLSSAALAIGAALILLVGFAAGR